MPRGLVKLKKNKNLSKTRIGQTTPIQPPYSFFLKHLETWKQQQKKKTQFQLPSFSRIFRFFLTWQNY